MTATKTLKADQASKDAARMLDAAGIAYTAIDSLSRFMDSRFGADVVQTDIRLDYSHILRAECALDELPGVLVTHLAHDRVIVYRQRNAA